MSKCVNFVNSISNISKSI